jgi:hypothetical protein
MSVVCWQNSGSRASGRSFVALRRARGGSYAGNAKSLRPSMARARQRRAVIEFGDEGGVRLADHAGTTLGVCGQAAVLPRAGARFSLNMVSVINARRQMRFVVRQGRLNADGFVDFQKRLMRGITKSVFSVFDGHSVQPARILGQYVATCVDRRRLFLLPPYAPKVNPEEWPSNHVKHHGVRPRSVHRNADPKAWLQARLRRT